MNNKEFTDEQLAFLRELLKRAAIFITKEHKAMFLEIRKIIDDD